MEVLYLSKTLKHFMGYVKPRKHVSDEGFSEPGILAFLMQFFKSVFVEPPQANKPLTGFV